MSVQSSYAELNVLPAPVTTGTTIQSFIDTNNELWVAKNGVKGGNWLKARDALHACVYRAAAYTPPTAISAFGADTVLHDAYGIWTGTPTNAFTLPVAGSSSSSTYPLAWWRFYFHWNMSGATSPNYIGQQIYQNGGALTQDNTIICVSGTVTGRTQVMWLCSANDTFQAYYSSSVASLTGGVGLLNNSFSCAFMGLWWG